MLRGKGCFAGVPRDYGTLDDLAHLNWAEFSAWTSQRHTLMPVEDRDLSLWHNLKKVID